MLETVRDNRRLMAQSRTRIVRLYEQCAADLAARAARPGTLTARWATTYTKAMRERVSEMWYDIRDITRESTVQAARNAVAVQIDLLGAGALKAGVDLQATFARVFGSVADEAAQSVLTGAVYQGKGAMLSKRIWNNAALQSGQLADVIAAGVAKQQSPIQLAKALEAFVKPDAAEPSNWNDVYENLPFAYNVEYNAKRLAVASINHAAWSGTLIAAQRNPYAEFLHWELTPSHGVPDICDTYADHEEGLGTGNYPLSSAPLPHPFCTCLWFVDTAKSIDQIADELTRWEQGERVPALDRAFGEWNRQESTEYAQQIEVADVQSIGASKQAIAERLRFTKTDSSDIMDLTAQDGLRVKNYSSHAYRERMIERGVTDEMIRDAFSSPLHIRPDIVDEIGRLSRRYIGREATVNVNPLDGTIATVWKTGSRTRRRYEKGV